MIIITYTADGGDDYADDVCDDDDGVNIERR